MKKSLFIYIFIFLSAGCAFDPFGFFHSVSDDVDERFEQSLLLPEVTNLVFSDSNFSFIVIADVHTYESNNANFKALSNKLIPSDEIILLAGDIVDNGQMSDYLLLKEDLEWLGLSYYAAVGNHDVYNRGWDSYKQVFGRSCYTFASGNARFICVDSASGTLGSRQREWLEQTLAGKTEALCFVFFHYNIISPFLGETQQYDDIEEIFYLMDLFERNEVDYVFMGHSHVYQHYPMNGVVYLNVDDFVDDGKYKTFSRIIVSNDTAVLESLPLND